MALKLDINHDTIIPSKAFQDWAEKVLTEKGIKTSVEIPIIGELFKRDKDLRNKLAELKSRIDRCPAGSDIWFSKMFLWPFGGKVTDAAKTYFEELQKKGRIKELEEGAKQAATARQANGTRLVAACVFALNMLENPNEGLPAAVGALSSALSATTAAPEAAVTKESLTTSLLTAIAAGKDSPETDSILTTLGYDAVAKDWVKTPNGTTELLGKLKTALDNPTKLAAVTTFLQGLTPTATPEQAKAALADVTAVAESRMFSSLDILLESGRITQEDYNRTSKRLSRTSVINEAVPTETPTEAEKIKIAAKAAEPRTPTAVEKTAAIVANKAKFGGFVSSIDVNCRTLDTELKGLETLGRNLANQSALSENVHRQIIKSYIKKRILQETAGKDSREQLNEFFIIAALLAALTGAIAWAAAKIGDFFKNSEFSRSSPTHASPSTPEQVTKAVKDLGSSLTAAYGPDGMLVDASGRRVVGEIQVKTAVFRQLDSSVESINKAMTLFTEIGKEAAQVPAATGAAQTGAAQLANYLGIEISEEKTSEITAALEKYRTYKSGNTIGEAVKAVKAALQAV